MSTASEASPLLRSPGALVAVLCITSVLGMLGFSSFPALLPEFQRDWGLSNTEAGWISGIFYAGYGVAGLARRLRRRRARPDDSLRAGGGAAAAGDGGGDGRSRGATHA